MSLLTSLIPLPYRIGAIAAIVIGLVIWGKVEWNHSVKVAADKVINAYVATAKKDDQELQAIETKTNTKIEIQYRDRVQVIVKQGKTNVQTIIQYVHDSEPLSAGWVSAHNSAAAGETVDPTGAADATPSGFTDSEALATVADNYATCQQYKARVTAFQEWVTRTNADISAGNAKAKK
jgi:hypothetical protein